MQHYSEGCRVAAGALRERGARATLERKLKGSSGRPLARGVLHRVLDGTRPMSLVLALQLRDALGIDPSLWDQPPIYAAVAYVPRGGLLAAVSRKDTHQLSAPGGKLELGESSSAAVARELYEETGLVALDTRSIYRGLNARGRCVEAYVVTVDEQAALVAREPGTWCDWIRPEAMARGFNGYFHRAALKAANLL